MKKSLIKNNLKTIIKTRRRFLSILAMAFLGVGFFSGLTASSPDMLNSLDKYTDKSNMFDISIISTLGLTSDDLNTINDIEGVEKAYGIRTKNSIAKFNEKESICKVIEYNSNINIPKILEGRLIENDNECLLDANYCKTNNYNEYIGKEIVLKNEDKDEEENDIFTKKNFKIVGIVQTPLYISSERGNANIGNGKIEYFIYINQQIINVDYYTQIDVKVANANTKVTNSDEYLNLVEGVLNRINNIKENREQERYNELVGKANQKIDDAQKEFDEEKFKVEKELKDAENAINTAKNELISNENNINKSENEINYKENLAKKQFEEAQNKIFEAQKQIQENENKLKVGKEAFETAKQNVKNAINQLTEQINLLQSADQTEEVKQQLQVLEIQKLDMENGLKEQEKQIIFAEEEINKAKQELEKNKNNLESLQKQTNQEIKNARTQIANGRKKIEIGKNELKEKEKELKNAQNEAEIKLKDAQNEINTVRDEVKKMAKAKWYIQDRKNNSGYANIFDAIETMANLSKMFPTIFYLVAVLISLTSMTRMVEEERIEIGTLKSLGYTNLQIISKYITYAFFACIIGGLLGMTVGFYLLPSIVWSLYSVIYKMPNFYMSYYFNKGLLGTVLAFVCIGGATILVSYKELKQMPSILMRPKPPKNGKKIFLERIGFIWKRLNFSKKVTARNIFRYKARAIITILGIAGCTGLMLTGFGIRDSVVDIPDEQFGKIFKYDATISLTKTDNLNQINEYLNKNEFVENYTNLCASTGKVKGKSSSYNTTIFVLENSNEIEKICNLIDSKTKTKIDLKDNRIVITNKIAELLGVKENDTITLTDSNDIEHVLKINAITENYVGHYIYMSKEYYEENFETYKTNMILLNTKEIIKEETSKLSNDLLNIDGVAEVSIIDDLIKQVSDMLNVMNYVVIVLIISSAILAFVVLYNLANINIGERQREIATLKVLGFYDKEVDNYINKENIIFTIVGVILGLGFGNILTNEIIASIEIDILRFIKNIAITSYIYSAIITILFSLIVNKIIHFVLKKINMIESLKSVE